MWRLSVDTGRGPSKRDPGIIILFKLSDSAVIDVPKKYWLNGFLRWNGVEKPHAHKHTHTHIYIYNIIKYWTDKVWVSDFFKFCISYIYICKIMYITCIDQVGKVERVPNAFYGRSKITLLNPIDTSCGDYLSMPYWPHPSGFPANDI